MYQGIKAWGAVRTWIDHSGDVDQIESVQFVPQFNNNTALLGPGCRGIWQWQMEHGTAFEIGRNDQFRLLDTFCLDYHFAVNSSGTNYSFVNCNFWNAYGTAVMINAVPYGPPNVSSPEVTFTSCQSQAWMISENATCIQADGGDARVMGCDFRLDDRPDLYSTAKTRQLLAIGNFGAGGVSVGCGSAAITQSNNLPL